MAKGGGKALGKKTLGGQTGARGQNVFCMKTKSWQTGARGQNVFCMKTKFASGGVRQKSVIVKLLGERGPGAQLGPGRRLGGMAPGRAQCQVLMRSSRVGGGPAGYIIDSKQVRGRAPLILFRLRVGD